MRNICQVDTRTARFLRALFAFLLWLFRFLSSPAYLVGFVIGLSFATWIFTDAVNEWSQNGGLQDACAQLEHQKQ